MCLPLLQEIPVIYFPFRTGRLADGGFEGGGDFTKTKKKKKDEEKEKNKSAQTDAIHVFAL